MLIFIHLNLLKKRTWHETNNASTNSEMQTRCVFVCVYTCTCVCVSEHEVAVIGTFWKKEKHFVFFKYTIYNCSSPSANWDASITPRRRTAALGLGGPGAKGALGAGCRGREWLCRLVAGDRVSSFEARRTQEWSKQPACFSDDDKYKPNMNS